MRKNLKHLAIAQIAKMIADLTVFAATVAFTEAKLLFTLRDKTYGSQSHTYWDRLVGE